MRPTNVRPLLPLALFSVIGCSKSAPPSQSPAAACTEPSKAPLDPATKRDDIRRVLELTGAAKLARQVMEPMIAQFQKLTPQAPPEFWDRLRARIGDEAMLALVVEVYDEELSHEEVMAMREFYESPHGRRIAEAMPQISAKAQAAGQRWGEQIARDIIDELTAAGYAGAPMD